MPVNVSDSDLDGVEVTVSVPPPIHGRLTLEGQLSQVGVDRMRVQMLPWVDGAISMARFMMAPPLAIFLVQPDGTFTVEGVSPGEYKVGIVAMDPNSYIKEVRLGSADALDRPMAVTATGDAILNIVISPRAAQLEGTVVDHNLQPVSGVQAVLIPDQHRDRADLYKDVVTDAAGRFQMQGIAPGDYKLFAWSSLDPYSYFNTNMVQRYESQGQPVHLLESSRGTVQAKVIP
jgi:hypothetical protein